MAVFVMTIGLLYFLPASTAHGQFSWTSTTTQAAATSKDVQSNVDKSKESGNWIIDWILRAVLQAMGWFLSAAASLFIWIIDTKNINATIGNSIVYELWAQVRDVINIAFILMLIFSAFCTIFQVEKYNYKKILLTLIIMALLVNFSFPIARTVIDFSNVIMYYFAQALNFKSSGNGGIFSKIITDNSNPIYKIINNTENKSTAYLITAIVFTFIYATTLLVIGVLFVIRLAVLTFLVIFSSVAFVGAVIPFLSSQASKWWDNLFKYAFFGPIMLFMIYVSIRMLEAINTSKISDNIKTIAQNQVVKDDGLVTLVSQMAFFAVPIVILWVGLGVAQSMNIAAAGAVTGFGKKMIGYGTGLKATMWTGRKIGGAAKYGVKAGLRKLDRDVLGEWSPRGFIKGWQERSEELDKRHVTRAAGGWRDTFHKKLDHTETNFHQLAVDRVKAEEMKRMKEHSDDFTVLGPEMAKLVGSNMKDAPERLAGIFRIAYGNRDQDEIVNYIRENWDKKILGNGKSFEDILYNDVTDPKKKMTKNDIVVEGFAVSEMVERMLSATQKTDQKYINKELSDLGQIAAGNGGIGFGATKINHNTGQLERTSKEEQAYLAVRKHQTVFEPQDQAKKEHRNWETNEYDPKIVNPAAIEKSRWISPANITQIERTHPSKVEQVGGNIQLSNSFYRELEKMREGTLEVWDGKAGKKVAISSDENSRKDERENYKNQAYIAAAYRAALQTMAGIDPKTISKQLQDHHFDISEINKKLSQAKRPKETMLPEITNIESGENTQGGGI